MTKAATVGIPRVVWQFSLIGGSGTIICLLEVHWEQSVHSGKGADVGLLSINWEASIFLYLALLKLSLLH